MTSRPAHIPGKPTGILQILKAYLSANRIGDLLVIKGAIEPSSLESALVLARARGHRIGRVLVDEGYIRRHELYAALGTQFGVRSLAWLTAFCMSVGTIMPRSARANEDGIASYSSSQSMTVNSAMRVSYGDAAVKSIKSYPALFGSGEKKSSDLSAFVKWTSMFARYNQQLESGKARAVLVNWQKEIASERGQDLVSLARGIDELVNRVPYIEDSQNWGRSDYWETPVEFFSRGGDCEDFAIAKYMSLKALGVSEDRLRIAIVHDMIKNVPHAILIVYTDKGPMVLDNQSQTTHFAEDVDRYKPIFSINAKSWWLHTRGANVQVASSSR